MNKLIEKIQVGNEKAFIELYDKFKPLIKKWLYKTKEFYQKNKEDYESMAKIILYESAIKFEEGRGVPFQSFYKINLYHWYGNHKRKKEFLMGQYQEEISLEDELTRMVEEKEQKLLLDMAIKSLSDKDRDIILKHLQGFTDEQIALKYKVSKKTIQNRRYNIINKLKNRVEGY